MRKDRCCSNLMHIQIAVDFPLLILIESLRLKWPLKLHCLGSSDFLRLYTSNSIRRLQKKRSVSIGNELKRCMQPLCLKSSSDCFGRILF